MNTEQILQQLRDERDRLSRAIEALEGSGGGTVARRGRKPGKKNRTGSGITPEGRKRLSEMMRKRWAERRKAIAKAK